MILPRQDDNFAQFRGSINFELKLVHIVIISFSI